MGPESFVELSKTAFQSDAEGGKHGEKSDLFVPGAATGPDEWKSVVRGSFEAGLSEVLDRVGVTKEEYRQAVEFGTTAYEALKDKGGLEALAMGAGFATKYGLKAAGFASMASPWGIAVSTAIEVAGSIYEVSKARARIGEIGTTFRTAEWVGIDNGALAHNVLDDDFGGAFPNQTPQFPEEALEMFGHPAVKKEISTGFYIGQGAEQNMVHVFNFKTLSEEEVHIFDVTKLSAAEASKMDGDAFASRIREMRFEEGYSTTTGSDVPTDPGTEVVYKGAQYNIVKAVGAKVIIEDTYGRRLFVDLGNLKRGRVTTTVSYNYTNEGEVAHGGFVSPGESAIYSGQFVWVAARSKYKAVAARELVAVHIIRADRVIGFYALDGEQGDFAEDLVMLLDDEFNATLNDSKAFMEFKGAAMAGYDMERVAPGQTDPLLCIAAVPVRVGKPRVYTGFSEGFIPGNTREYFMGGTGDAGLSKTLDATRDIADHIDGVPQQETDGAFEDPQTAANSGTSLFPIIALIAGGLFLFNSLG